MYVCHVCHDVCGVCGEDRQMGHGEEKSNCRMKSILTMLLLLVVFCFEYSKFELFVSGENKRTIGRPKINSLINQFIK